MTEEAPTPEQPAAQRVELSIPFGTIVKVLVAAILVFAVLKLWLPFLIFLVAVLIAVTLAPVVTWLEKSRAVRTVWRSGSSRSSCSA